jgi:DNA-binding response OmpR family regulator
MVENHTVFARTVVGHFLSDHDVSVVPSVAAAKAILACESYDAVLVDYDLDDGKGDDVVGWLRARSFGGLIVAISSHEDGNAALVVAGAHAVCSKTKFHTIRDVISTWPGRRAR